MAHPFFDCGRFPAPASGAIKRGWQARRQGEALIQTPLVPA
jgi:hypothetical protein